MSLLKSFALLILLMSSNLYAQEMRIQLMGYQKMSEVQSVVQVLSSGRGSGVIVIKDNVPVIVTNSHILQGKTSAMITLPERFVEFYKLSSSFDRVTMNLKMEGMAKVLYDFPLSDVAVLSLPEGLTAEERAVIFAYGLANGVFSSDKGWLTGKRSLSWGDYIAAVLQDKATKIEALEGFTGSTIPDTFISGDKNPIWAIPIFARPGVSGGAYYKDGILHGLVTKISLAGEPIALATPFSKIGKLLYSPDPIEKQVSWDNELMVYKAKDKTVSINPLGNGALGNGGDLIEVDESISGDNNPNYWRLQLGTILNKVITTWDPFVYRPGQFSVNNESVSFLRVKTKGLFSSSEMFRIPSLASYIASERKGEQQTLLTNTAQNLEMLRQARLKQKTAINTGRLYTHDYSRNYYKIFNLRPDNINGAQPLIPESSERWAKPRRYDSRMGPKPIFDMDAGVKVDKDGYFVNYPFSTKVSANTIFDLKISGEFFGSSTRQESGFLKGSADLSKVTLKLVNGAEVMNIEMKPVEFNSPNSLVFKSDNDAFRVIYLYSNDDLSKLARIYFVNEGTLIELWAN